MRNLTLWLIAVAVSASPAVGQASSSWRAIAEEIARSELTFQYAGWEPALARLLCSSGKGSVSLSLDDEPYFANRGHVRDHLRKGREIAIRFEKPAFAMYDVVDCTTKANYEAQLARHKNSLGGRKPDYYRLPIYSIQGVRISNGQSHAIIEIRNIHLIFDTRNGAKGCSPYCHEVAVSTVYYRKQGKRWIRIKSLSSVVS